MTPPLPYGDEIINAEIDEINEDYNDVLYNYIVTEVVVTDKESICVLAKIIKQKHGNQGNPIGKENTKPILETRLYELEVPDGQVE